MKRMIFTPVFLLLSISILNSCSVFKQSASPVTKRISINSYPEGAMVVYEGEHIGITPFEFNIPLTHKVHRKGFMTPTKRAERSSELNVKKFTFIKDGYAQGEEIYKPNVDKNATWIWSNQENGFDYPDHIFHSFSVNVDPTIPVGEATNMVTREAPGQSALERTIIRWYFDSAPRGARIFWRVISSAPDQVKNTNELYLTTTPYEETRSFNILGLTYENARDVTIEVKVTAPGYHDQVKRFNARQAIDQQEISGFFDLVKIQE